MAKGKLRRPRGMVMPALNAVGGMPKPKIAPAPPKMAARPRTGIQAANNMAKARAKYRGKTPKAG